MFRVRLKKIHQNSQLSKYRVHKDTGVAPDTVSFYVDNDYADVGTITPALVRICQYYGVDWQDTEIIAFKGNNVEDETPGQLLEAV